MPTTTVAPEAQNESGAHERHLAAGSIAQQITLVLSTLTMLVVITVLARTLSLNEFGVYGVLISLPTYLLFVQGSVETAAIKAIAGARDQEDRDRAITTALGVYVCFGLLASLLIVFGGTALLGVFSIAHSLRSEAQQGLLALGVVTLMGWPIKTAQDALRGSGLFVVSASAEAMAYVTFGLLIGSALVLSTPLWLIIGLGGSISLLVGLWASAMLLVVRLPFRLRFSTLSYSYTRAFLSLSFYLILSGPADLAVYSVDRVILGAYRPLATVGLYEGPVRAHNLIRQLQGALVTTVMPSAATYIETGDYQRLRELLLRGTRYVVMIMTPLTITFMVLADPILKVWLGPRFSPAATAMTILVSYWLLAGGISVGLTMMIAVGRVKLIAAYGYIVAVLNLAISLALTPSLGLNGVVIGTSLPFAIMIPVFTYLVCRTFEISIGEYLREVFTNAFVAGSLLAVFELFALDALPIDHIAVLMSTVLLGIGGYALLVYTTGLRPRERLLVRTLLTGARHRLTLATATLARSG